MKMHENSHYQQNSSIFLIHDVEDYRMVQQPILTSKKKQIIEDQLKLQKQARKQAAQREKNADYFIKYDYNPFVTYNHRDIQSLIKMKKQKGENQFEHIIEKLNKLTQNKQARSLKPSIQNKTRDCQFLKNQISQFSDKLLDTINKKNNQSGIDQIIYNDKFNKKNECSRQAQFSKLDIEKIANEKEDNFFMKKRNDFNIFSIIRDDNDEISPFERLKKYHFSFNSMCEKISRMKMTIYRDISLLGRRTAKNSSVGTQSMIQYLDSSQLSFKLNYLMYVDIMSIASNRFTAQFVSRMLNGDEIGGNTNKQSSQISSQVQEQIIVYRYDQACKNNSFIDENEEVQQIKDYARINLNNEQNKYSKIYSMKQKKIAEELKVQKNLYDNTIKDNMIHYSINDKVKDQVQSFFQMNSSNIDIDRLVRVNKLAKNKKQSIKMKSLLQTLAAKKQHDDIITRKGRKQKIIKQELIFQ